MDGQTAAGERIELERRTGPAPTLRSLIDDFDKYDAHPALIQFTRAGSNSITYTALAERIRRVAAGFERLGIKNGNTVIVFAANSPAWVICALAAVYSGLVVVPVDPQQSAEVLEHIVKDSKAVLIFTDENGVKKLEEAKIKTELPHAQPLRKGILRLYRIDKEQGADSWTKLECKRNDFEDFLETQEVPEDDTAILFYTSGTTGMPKGVPLTHKNIRSQLDAAFAQMTFIGPTDRILLPLPLFHVYPLNIGLLGPLKLGLPIIMPQSLTGPELMRAINEGQATILVSVPRILRSLFEAMDKKAHASKVTGKIFDTMMAIAQTGDRCGIRIGKLLFKGVREKLGPTLRVFTSGGAPLEPALTRKFKALGWDIAIGYGLTETSPLLAMRMPENPNIEGTGKPIPNVELKIIPIQQEDDEKLDDTEKIKEPPADEQQKPVKEPPDKEEKAPVKEPEHNENEGEVVARGPNVFSGYLNLKDKTKEAFTEDGWFRTGDLGFIKNGNLHITGRASSTMVMEGGKKFQPDDVEEKLAKQEAIREIALLKKDNKLVALVVPELKSAGDGGAKESVSNALKSAASGMASYLHITDFAITREPLPRTNLGKLKRHELEEKFDKAKAEEKAGKRTGAIPESDFSPEDRALINDPAAGAVWEWLKKRFPDHDLTLDTSPELELNIDSLEWMNLTLEMVENSGVEINQEALARVNTVRDLLKEVQSSSQQGNTADSPIKHPERFLDEKSRVFVEPLTKEQEAQAKAYLALVMFLMKPFKLETIGYENVPDEQVVFIPNHASFMDAFALTASLPEERMRKTQWAGWVGIAFGNPVFAYLSRLAQVIPIDAEKSMLTSLALGAAVLKQGRSLVWFPEAKRTLDGNLLPFKQGIGILMKDKTIPLVPVYLDGTREALGPGAYFPTPVKIRVWYGQPVQPSQLIKEGVGDTPQERLANALRDHVLELEKKAKGDKSQSKSSKELLEEARKHAELEKERAKLEGANHDAEDAELDAKHANNDAENANNQEEQAIDANAHSEDEKAKRGEKKSKQDAA
jgi:long-chain acyl-CoA synthetase